MQTQHLSILDPPFQHQPQLNTSATPFNLPVIHTEHCAPAADAAFERCPGRAMQSLSLPPPTSLPSTPFGRYQEPGIGLAKFPPQFTSPGRPEQHSYPSPPMSDSHSPARRSAHVVDPEGHPYPPSLHEARRIEGLASHQPPSSLLDPRSATVPQALPQQRPLYPSESHPRGPPMHYPPSYGPVHPSQNYVYGYPPTGVPPYLGSQAPGPGPEIQSSAIMAPQPLRQNKPARRTKAHVASACVNCKKAHLSCDVQRPCGRCVASGKQDTCKDVQHKKRGRPRLRDDKEFGRSEEVRMASTQVLGALPQPVPDILAQQSPFTPASRAPETYRMLTSAQEEISKTGLQTAAVPSAHAIRGSQSGIPALSYSTGPNLAYQSLSVAFLDLDLVIQKTNQSFQELVSFLGDVRGKNLVDLLESRQHELLQQLRTELRVERDEREPTYMAPITPIGQDPMRPVMHSVSDKDVDQVSQGFTERPVLLSFRLPNGQSQSLQAQLRLAKTSLYFVTLVVHAPPRSTGPHLLTTQLAPPTPVPALQTMSAPTKVHPREPGIYPLRPTSSAGSAPSSPFYNFNTVKTPLPTVSSSSYGSSPSYGYSPTAGPEQGYFPTFQPPSQPGAYPSSYQPAPRTNSVTSEAQRGTAHTARLEGLQLPPIRTTPAPLGSPLAQDISENTRDRERVRRRASRSSAEARPETPDPGKRRRLNIHEVLE